MVLSGQTFHRKSLKIKWLCRLKGCCHKSPGLVEIFSIRAVHPFCKFIISGLRCVLIPAGHARFYANLRLKPHNFLVPLPDQFAIAGKQERAGRRFKTRTGGEAAPLDPCRVVERSCAVQQFALMPQISISSSRSRTASPARRGVAESQGK